MFRYVIWSLERLVTEEYVLVYLHGSAASRRLPTFHWLHQCYKLINRRYHNSTSDYTLCTILFQGQ
jgi:prune homolog 2